MAPASVFLDIDFSAASNPTDDTFLETALAAHAERAPVRLAAHFQPVSRADSRLVHVRPLPRFAEHGEPVYVNLAPGPDGFVRELRSTWTVDGDTVRSLMSHDGSVADDSVVRIDYSIRPSSFAYVSFSDLLLGHVPAAGLAGRQVYVGATALELGDVVPVPVYQSLPGIVVLALATETARAGLIGATPEWLYMLLLLAFTLALARLGATRGWRFNAAVALASVALLGGIAVYLYAAHRLHFDSAAFAAAAACVFLALTLRALDFETWRALAFAVGLKRRDALLSSIVESSSDAIVCIDGSGSILAANPAAHSLFAAEAERLEGRLISGLIPDLGLPPGDEAFDALRLDPTEHEALSSSGRRFPVELSLSRVRVEGERQYTAIIRDITERKAREQQLKYRASHDSLTGLPNRAALMGHLGAMLAKDEPGQRAALLMLDLCRFKEVNDTLGHEVGDEVLREVAARFECKLDQHAFIGRIGGDEFVVVVPRVGSRQAIDALCRQLGDTLKEPIHARGIAIEVGLSIGVAMWPDDGPDAQALLRHADISMYVAKRRNSAFEYYRREHDQSSVRRLAMVSELRAAIANSTIELHYQPQLNLKTGCVERVEALVRWQHPMIGTVSPFEFVTLAESTDLIRPLTDWTLVEALRQVKRWHARGIDLRVSVNISVRILQDGGFPARLRWMLAETEVPAESLELEITESAMMLDPERAKSNLRELHALGVEVAVDDFGTGFSSLAYLRDLPVHALKLDKSFVIDLETRPENRVIVESTAQLAHALGLEIVAEGVETEWVRAYLARVGYDRGQGFGLGRPLPADQCLPAPGEVLDRDRPQRRTG